MEHPYFRVKVDLSKFFHDARQSCWIFVDGTKIKQIGHFKQHISKLLNMEESFHLLLKHDTAYLPPTEDVRVLKENDTILVVPGSGVETCAALSTSGAISDVEIYKNLNKIKTSDSTTHNMDASIKSVTTVKEQVVVRDELDLSENKCTHNEVQLVSINNMTRDTADMTFYSMLNDTVVNDTDTKTTDCTGLTEDYNTTNSVIPPLKRKRVRKRKPKNKLQLIVQSSDTNEGYKSKRHKTVTSFATSPEKHIRFDDTEETNTTEAEDNDTSEDKLKKISMDQWIKSIQLNMNKASSAKDLYTRELSTLLALKGSSTPITFTKKPKDEMKEGNSLENETKMKDLNASKNSNVSIESNLLNKQAKDETQNHESVLHVDPERIPIMTRKPHIGDTIAFKTLKMAADYTPQVSNFIIGKVLNFCTQSATYIFKILQGKEEIEMPFGKFSISEDESVCPLNEIALASEDIREPRLIA